MFNKFIKEIYNEAGLKDNGFVLNSKDIILAPVKDFVRGYTFRKSDNHFFVSKFIQPIYYPSEHIAITYGGRLIGSHTYGEMFFLDENNIEFSKNEVIRLINGSKQNLLDIETPNDFYDRFHDLSAFDKYHAVDTMRHKAMMAVTLCYAAHTGCGKSIDDALQYWEKSDRKNLPWMQGIAANLNKLKASGDDREKREKLFNEWKSFSLGNLRLEKFSFKEKKE